MTFINVFMTKIGASASPSQTFAKAANSIKPTLILKPKSVEAIRLTTGSAARLMEQIPKFPKFASTLTCFLN